MDAGETNRFGDGMARALHGSAAAMQPEPGREEIAALVELARRHTSAVVGTFNGRLRRGQLELVARLAGAGGPPLGGGPEAAGGPARKRVDAGGIRVYGAEHSGGCARAARRGRTNRKAARDFMSGEEKMPDMRYAAGMDGGGTKTVLEARAPDGRVLRERFGPLNLNSAASQAVRETMQGCTDALARLPGSLEACAALCVGSAGVSNPQARALLEQMLRRCGYRGALLLTGDQETALAGALGGTRGLGHK